MKQAALFAMLLLTGLSPRLFAHEGYHINLKMTDVKDSMVYLVHYYGQNRPKIYLSDSAIFDKNGLAVFDSKDASFTGGIYIILLKNKTQTNFEILLNNGDDISIAATKSNIPGGIKFKNSPENVRFGAYIGFLKEYSADQEKLKKELESAKTSTDTEYIRKRSIAQAKRLTDYRTDYVRNNPNTLLAKIFGAMQIPEIPEGPHYLEDGVTKDSTFAYRYYKSHFWDGFDFRDDRMIYTPLYDQKIEEYFSKLVLPWPDSVEHEGDILLAKARGTKDVFHYTLWWLTSYVENSKVMGMDEAFVYFVENYYMKGDAFWLKNDELQKYIDRAQKIAPNVIGNLAPEIKLPNVTIRKDEDLLDNFKAKYTIVVFYSPNCGHCQHELPLLDSAYEASLKSKGVKIFTIATEGDEKAINDFVKKNKLDDWTNTWINTNTMDPRNKYDVYSTPTIYLLDEKKIIRGKRLDHSNIGGLIDMLDKKKLSKK